MGEVPVGAARLTVAHGGPEHAPSIVFVHAAIADHRSWLETMELLADDYRVVAYDRRGFGSTAYAPETHDQTIDLMAVLDALGIERCVLVGNSQGGRIALDATLARPERVGGLVLVAPAVTGAPAASADDVGQEVAEIWASLEAADKAGALDALNLGEIRLWVDGPTAREGRVSGARRDLALAMNARALSAENPGYEPEPPDAWSRLGEVDVATVVMVGALDLAHVRARSAIVAERIAGARLEVIPQAAHLIALEQPDVAAAALTRFMGELAATT